MILIACGLKAEAKWLGRDGVVVVAGGGDETRLEAELERHAGEARAILSMGIAGGLAPSLRAGNWVVGTVAPDDAGSGWIARIAGLLPGATTGRIHAENRIVATAAEKRALHRRTGAIACDMESHVAARVAGRHGLPFAVARTISDPAARTMPAAVLVAMRPDGGIAHGRVARAVIGRPWELPRLIATARDMARAGAALRRGYDTLARGGFGLADPR